jgi:hypothetical protein
MIAYDGQLPDPEQYAAHLCTLFPHDVIQSVLDSDYTVYKDDPVGFIRNVMGIELTPDVATLAESVRDNRITVARSATGTGKSHGASAIAIWFYKAFPNSRVYTIANPYENQKILWGEIDSMAEDEKLFSGDEKTTMRIERSSKDFITALTVPTTGTDEVREGKFSGKHHEHMLFIVDEGDTVPDFAYKGVEGCMSGGHVRMLVLFNPRSAMGAPYRMERDRVANVVHLSAFNHPNVITGEDVIPGAVDRPTTIRRINQWCRPMQPSDKPSEESRFLLPAFLEGVVGLSESGAEYPPLEDGHYVIKNPAFSYMTLGRYPAQGENQLISREWIATARERWNQYEQKFGETPPQNVQPILGGDVADKGMDSNVAALRYGGYLSKFICWPGIDIIDTGDRFARLYHDNKAQKAYLDATGVGAGIAPYMRRLKCIEAYGVMVASKPTIKTEMGEFTQMRDQLWWSCREWLRTDPYAALPPDELLIEELGVPTYEIVNGKIKIMPKDEMKEYIQRSPDRADALCMTFATGLVDMPKYTGSARTIEESNYYYG